MDEPGDLIVDETTDQTAGIGIQTDKKASNLNNSSDSSASDSATNTFSSSDKENNPKRANQRHDSLDLSQ